jgi:hypothetical protein
MKNLFLLRIIVAFIFSSIFFGSYSQINSIAREWNKVLIEAIRNDYARPPVHARNLFHHSVIMHDCWAAYNPGADTYFLNKNNNGFECPFNGVTLSQNDEKNIERAISYASYRFISNRFQNSPNFFETLQLADSLMNALGFSIDISSIDYSLGPSELGNFIAYQIEIFGLSDGSMQSFNYENLEYFPVNPPIFPYISGTNYIINPDHWQQISLPVSIDQSGNIVSNTPNFIGAEWGNVYPFSLPDSVSQDLISGGDGNLYKVYLNPGLPPSINDTDSLGNLGEFYKWNHSMVSVWQSHLNPNEDYLIDISPASIGNITQYPLTHDDYQTFYNFIDGGVNSLGHTINPVTNLPYAENIVKRSDYARVLAEFWADGIDSETPPGHWFEIFHYASSQTEFNLLWNGLELLDTLEYDIKAHLSLGAAMHDAAIAAWSIKGYYDYVRPISAIRYMCERGQSTDSTLMSYDPEGIKLIDGFIELVQFGDSLAGIGNQNVGKIKVYSWRGPSAINNPESDYAGVGWILGEDWWPYQRPSFVTPPFAGYVSGHSTFSRAAADVISHFSGSEYFPGGLGEFVANQNEFLVFEEGPSQTITLQWATYRDAADQCSLSRIWGGIHPPCDDIPGREIGSQVANFVINKTEELYSTFIPAIENLDVSVNTINLSSTSSQFYIDVVFNCLVDTTYGDFFFSDPITGTVLQYTTKYWLNDSTLRINFNIENQGISLINPVIKFFNFLTVNAIPIQKSSWVIPVRIDQNLPEIESDYADFYSILNSDLGSVNVLSIAFNEQMDTTYIPQVQFLNDGQLFQINQTDWLNDSTLFVSVEIGSQIIENSYSSVSIVDFFDLAGNSNDSIIIDLFHIDTKIPEISFYSISDSIFGLTDITNSTQSILVTFSEKMDTLFIPSFHFTLNAIDQQLTQYNENNSLWINDSTYQYLFTINYIDQYEQYNIRVKLDSYKDIIGNGTEDSLNQWFAFDFVRPELENYYFNKNIISDSVIGVDQLQIDLIFSENVSLITSNPYVAITQPASILNSVNFNFLTSGFLNDTSYHANFIIQDQGEEITGLNLNVIYFIDKAGNQINPLTIENVISIDTKNPTIEAMYLNDYLVEDPESSCNILLLFSESMFDYFPQLTFNPDEINGISEFYLPTSSWINEYTFEGQINFNGAANYENIDFEISGVTDLAGNAIVPYDFYDVFDLSVVELFESNLSNQGCIVYPNPVASGGALNFKFLPSDIDPNYKIIDFTGKIYQEGILTLSDKGFRIDEISVSSGYYFLAIHGITFKLIVL